MGRTMAAEVGYVRTDGNDFPLQRQFTQAFDRQTGARPNPSLGAPGGYYVDSSQTMDLQRLADVVEKALFESILVGRQLHARQERVDAGRRPLGVLHRRRSRTTRTSGIPNSTAGRPATTSGIGSTRRSSTSCRHSAAGRHERRARRLADFRHRPDAIGECAAHHAAVGNQPQPARRRRRAWI